MDPRDIGGVFVSNPHVLTLHCDDRPGIVSAVSTHIFDCGGNILDAQQFDDADTGRFFMRVVFDVKDDADARIALSSFSERFAAMAERMAMAWKLRPVGDKKRVMILVSKFDHCLIDLLYRMRIGELPMQVVSVVSNHTRDHLDASTLGDIPYHFCPVARETKLQQEAQIMALIEKTDAELVILARYMQILSDRFARHLTGRCINIHHSFLPGFKGAQPYHQAYQRGVKIIGATAHYVTGELDEGPIIAQDVERVSHTNSPAELVRRGRDIERRVLSRAVALHLQERVLVNGAKTVVFDD